MHNKTVLGLCLFLCILTGCAAYKPRPVNLIKMKVLNESYDLTHEDLKVGKLSIIPCVNKTEFVEITSLLDSILINELPEIFPDFISINDSFEDLVKQRNFDNKFLNPKSIKKFNILENFIFLVEVDSIWNKNIEGSSFNYNSNFNNPTSINNPTWLITILELKLSIFDQEQARIIWERKIQSGVSEVDNNIFINLLNNKSDSNYKTICNHSIKPITVALNVLQLPIDLQKELDNINTSKDYKIPIESTLKIFEWIGAKVTKKKFEYKIEFNERKIFIPLDTKYLTTANYNDILGLLEECKLYYEKFIEKEKGYL